MDAHRRRGSSNAATSGRSRGRVARRRSAPMSLGADQGRQAPLRLQLGRQVRQRRGRGEPEGDQKPFRWAFNPNDMVLLSADGRLFVACSNENTVYVIDTKTLEVLETLSISPLSQGAAGLDAQTPWCWTPSAACCSWPTPTTTTSPSSTWLKRAPQRRPGVRSRRLVSLGHHLGRGRGARALHRLPARVSPGIRR